jgi:hypothetical protein
MAEILNSGALEIIPGARTAMKNQRKKEAAQVDGFWARSYSHDAALWPMNVCNHSQAHNHLTDFRIRHSALLL